MHYGYSNYGGFLTGHLGRTAGDLRLGTVRGQETRAQRFRVASRQWPVAGGQWPEEVGGMLSPDYSSR